MAALLAMMLGAALLGACGGGGDGDEEPTPTAVAETPAGGEETPAASGNADEESVAVGESFWHAGWKVTLGQATFFPDGAEDGGAGPTLHIDATFENLGADTDTFNSQLVLSAGSAAFEANDLETELPEVPGGFSGEGVIAFDMGEDFSFDDVVLTVGNPDNNQARVPIGPGPETLVSLEPREIAVAGPIVAGALSVTVEGAEARTDLPEVHSITERGFTTITFRFSATPAAGIQIGQGVLQSEALALKLPDGTAVAVRSDGRSGVNELLQGKEGTTIPGLSVRFEIPTAAPGDPDPAPGAYALVLRGAYGPGGAQVEAELPFTVE